MDSRWSMAVAVVALAALVDPSYGHRVNSQLVGINLDGQTRRPTSDKFILGQGFASDNQQDENEKRHETNTSHLYRMDVSRVNGFSYIGHIEVGEPTRRFRVLLDSGSGDFWIPSSGCKNVDKSITNTYEPNESSTFVDDGRWVNFDYAGGVSVAGRLGRELVHFGQLAMRNFTFIRVDSHSNGQALRFFDGILGLRFSSTSGQSGVVAPIRQILAAAAAATEASARPANEGQANSMLSLSLNYNGETGGKGVMVVGGLDESLYVGAISWTPLIRFREWRFRVDSIELNFVDENNQPIMNDLTVCANGCNVLADTGSMMISGNPRDIGALNEKIGAVHAGRGRFVLASCVDVDSRLPHLAVAIAGRKFSLKPSQYTVEIQSICYSGFKAVSGASYWNLGNIFLANFYAIFDEHNQRFGLAESPHTADNSNLF